MRPDPRTTMAVRKLRNSWWVDFRWKSVRYRKRSPVNTRAGASLYELHMRERIVRGESPEASSTRPVQTRATSMNFADFAEQWFATYVVVNNKPSEQRKRRNVLRAHLVPWFGNLELGRISTRGVEEFKLDQLRRNLARKTVNNHLAILARCLRSAMQWGHTEQMPTIQLLRVGAPPFKVLTKRESCLLFRDNSEPMWNLMIRIALRTGLRRGELMALDWTDIDLQHNRLTVRHAASAGVITSPKTFQVRTIPLASDIAEELTRSAKVSGFVFTSPSGQLCREGTVEVAIRRICDRLGIQRIGWHALRHTFATDLAAAGVPLHVVKELLGHATITMTMRYAHVAPSMLDSAICTLERTSGLYDYPEIGQPAGNMASLGQSAGQSHHLVAA